MDEALRHAPYRDPALPVETRVEDLLDRMTLDEKLAQLAGIWVPDLCEGGALVEERARQALRHGVGHISRIAGATLLRPREVARLANDLQRLLREHTRLGLPAVVHEEALGGFLARHATCFPQALGLASTWRPELVEEMAGVIRLQMRAVGAHHALSPVLDLMRDPRWGRCEETYGEDPYLAGRMGVAYVRGLQGVRLREGVVATGKHFLAHGASEGGLNWAPAPVPPRELLDRYLLPFAAAIHEAGLASVMNAYHELDGVPCGASRYLLQELLRERLGFDGVLVSDYTTVATLASYHHIAGDRQEAARRALEAGIDVELPAQDCYGEPLRQALERGEIAMELVDRSVRRVVRQKIELGLLEAPLVDPEAAPALLEAPAHRELAGRLAAASMVLLRNEGGLLPLSPGTRCVAVLGPAAHSARLLQGDYHYPTHLEILFDPIREEALGAGAGASRPPGTEAPELETAFVDMVTILEGLQTRLSPGARVLHAPGCSVTGGTREGLAAAVAAAREADVAIVAVGGRSGLVEGCTGGEFMDRATLDLPGLQQTLVEEVVATGTPTVVVLVGGRPLALPWIATHVPAILQAWLPGEEGGHAVARVLLGEVNPAGRLPVTVPRGVGQVPLSYLRKPSGGRSHIRGPYVDLSNEPLYPFGHGLSYTTFSYEDLEIEPTAVQADGNVLVSVSVRNTGGRAGEEVVQLYLRDLVASVTRPVQQLGGFARLHLEPGEARRVAFHVDLTQLAFHDLELQPVVEPGEVEVMVGASAVDLRQRGTFTVTGEGRRLPDLRRRPTRVQIVPPVSSTGPAGCVQ